MSEDNREAMAESTAIKHPRINAGLKFPLGLPSPRGLPSPLYHPPREAVNTVSLPRQTGHLMLIVGAYIAPRVYGAAGL